MVVALLIWQRYVQDSYSKAPLPDVIVGVLQAQPQPLSFKIADVYERRVQRRYA